MFLRCLSKMFLNSLNLLSPLEESFPVDFSLLFNLLLFVEELTNPVDVCFGASLVLTCILLICFFFVFYHSLPVDGCFGDSFDFSFAL